MLYEVITMRSEESWDRGLIQIYEALANDFMYPVPENMTIFPDNHDMSRFFVQVGEDVDLLKAIERRPQR